MKSIEEVVKQYISDGGTGASPANIQAAYTARFGAQLEGDKIFFMAKLVSNLSGISSTPRMVSGVTAAA